MSDKLIIEGELIWVADYEVYGFMIADNWLENYIDDKLVRKTIEHSRFDEAQTYGKVRITIERLEESD